MAEDKKAASAAEKPKGAVTHIRFVGDPSEGEGSSCTVFGKTFYRGKWVPLTNLDGTNTEKKALDPSELAKLKGNPAFQLGDGTDAPVPGVDGEAIVSEEA